MILSHMKQDSSQYDLHTFSNLSGIIFNSPLETASSALSAKGSIVTNHCLLTRGSIIWKTKSKVRTKPRWRNYLFFITSKKKKKRAEHKSHTSPPRWDLGTREVWVSFFTAKPVSSRSDQSFFLASNRSRPLHKWNNHIQKQFIIFQKPTMLQIGSSQVAYYLRI